MKVATLGTVTAPVVAAVGLGPEPSGAAPTPETLRRAAAVAVRALAGSASVAVSLPVDEDAPAALRAVAEGALLGAYRFAGYKSRPLPARRTPVPDVAVHVPDAADETVTGRGRPRPGRRRRGRPHPGLGQHRPQRPAPAGLRRRRSPRPAGAAGLEVEVLDEEALAAGGYGGILAVGLGSAAPPRLVKLTYTPDVPGHATSGSRWSARASRSTPAASPSSRRRACGR